MSAQNLLSMTDLQKFWVSFVLICVSSLTLHVLVFSKRMGRDQHHPPVYPDNMVETPVPHGDPVEGTVSILGTDRFYIVVDGRQMMFLYGGLDRPAMNERVRVHYFDGTPPIAQKVEKL